MECSHNRAGSMFYRHKRNGRCQRGVHVHDIRFDSPESLLELPADPEAGSDIYPCAVKRHHEIPADSDYVVMLVRPVALMGGKNRDLMSPPPELQRSVSDMFGHAAIGGIVCLCHYGNLHQILLPFRNHVKCSAAGLLYTHPIRMVLLSCFAEKSNG